MRLLFALVSLPILAQAPATPVLKWRGSIWGGYGQSNRTLADGSLFLRSVDKGDGQVSLDGFTLGADVGLAEGWALKFTLLTGETARLVNSLNQDSGSLATPEVVLTWNHEGTQVQFGRMWTPMGMEVLDATQDIAASRGLIFTYTIPFAQVGLHVRQALHADWNADLWVYNGEDRIKDNNRGKTYGLGLNWAPGGSTDHFANLMVFRGPEQDSIASAANPTPEPGAEGRIRERISASGQVTAGALVIQMELEWGKEAFPQSALAGATGPESATWKALGANAKWTFSPAWAAYGRFEVVQDDRGVRLSLDPSVAAAWGNRMNAALKATDLTLGGERRWGSTFLRAELRQDRLNKDVPDAAGLPFRATTSFTLQFGSSF